MTEEYLPPVTFKEAVDYLEADEKGSIIGGIMIVEEVGEIVMKLDPEGDETWDDVRKEAILALRDTPAYKRGIKDELANHSWLYSKIEEHTKPLLCWDDQSKFAKFMKPLYGDLDCTCCAFFRGLFIGIAATGVLAWMI